MTICSKCNQEKPINEFYENTRSLACKECHRAYARVHKKQYYNANKEYLKQYQREYRRQQYKINPEKFKQEAKKYQHGEKYKESRRCYEKKRSKKPENHIRRIMRFAIWNVLRNGKNNQRWQDLVGYSINDLKRHLEKQFQSGMSWDNYGRHGWHIDHKIPISAFNFIDYKHRDFKRCFALQNLSPLWAKDNFAKGDSLAKDFQPSLLI